jgi:hypothetical protein
MIDLEEKLISRWSARTFLIAGAVIVAIGYLPLEMYILLGPRDGNPIGLGLLFITATPLGLLIFVIGLIKLIVRYFLDRGELSMFKVIGILVALYALYAAITGRVYIKSGPWGRFVQREESPEYFWISVIVYAGLATALVTFF